MVEQKLSELSKRNGAENSVCGDGLHQPKLLILDEPFFWFDPVNANLVKRPNSSTERTRTTIILSTHRMESVEELCDSVALINKSRKILDGKVFEVREKIQAKFIQRGFCHNVNAENLETLKISINWSIFMTNMVLISFDLNYNETKIFLLNDLMKAGKKEVLTKNSEHE